MAGRNQAMERNQCGGTGLGSTEERKDCKVNPAEGDKNCSIAGLQHAEEAEDPSPNQSYPKSRHPHKIDGENQKTISLVPDAIDDSESLGANGARHVPNQKNPLQLALDVGSCRLGSMTEGVAVAESIRSSFRPLNDATSRHDGAYCNCRLHDAWHSSATLVPQMIDSLADSLEMSADSDSTAEEVSSVWVYLGCLAALDGNADRICDLVSSLYGLEKQR